MPTLGAMNTRTPTRPKAAHRIHLGPSRDVAASIYAGKPVANCPRCQVLALVVTALRQPGRAPTIFADARCRSCRFELSIRWLTWQPSLNHWADGYGPALVDLRHLGRTVRAQQTEELHATDPSAEGLRAATTPSM